MTKNVPVKHSISIQMSKDIEDPADMYIISDSTKLVEFYKKRGYSVQFNESIDYERVSEDS